MKCGIIGLPNVGKSTLFNCLSKLKVNASNYPFCTIEPNVGLVSVPDSRIFKLKEIVNPEKCIPALVQIIDIAGIVKGASKGEGLGNKFLSHIRQTQALIHVLRCFDNENIVHVNNYIDPIADKEVVNLELQMKDLEIVENKIKKLEKSIKFENKDKKELLFLNKIYKHLLKSKNLRELNLNHLEKLYIDELGLITFKPILYICNVDESSVINENKYTKAVKKSILLEENSEVLNLCIQSESDIIELDSFSDRESFLLELGLLEPGINRLIRAAYSLLSLQTYFTVGKKEIHAWTIKKGSTALKAAGIIHSDFAKGFIRAEVIKYHDYIKFQSENKLREAGKISIEGREYIVKDGDIIKFRFN